MSTTEAPSLATAQAEAWHRLAAESVTAHLGVTMAGLSPEEAARRLSTCGPNELRRDDGPSPLALLLGQFRSLIVGLLVGAAGVSALLGEWLDAAAILAIVVLNGIIGFLQEHKAERALAALRRMTAPTARVRRGGRSLLVPAREVVPGDVLELEAGDLVPADARLVDVASFRTNEAPLTGESEPVEKSPAASGDGEVPLAERTGMVYLGTSVAAGRGTGVVVATGMQTEFGRIMELLASAGSGEVTPLQARLHALGRVLTWGSLGLVALLFGIGLARGLPAFDLFLTSVSLAVAAVPEGLPAVVTIALALGVQRMARRRALVRRLHAVETLGSTSVICSDKTGTLTVGEMTARTLWLPGRAYDVLGEGYAPLGSIHLDGRPLDASADPDLQRLLTVMVGCNGAALSEESGTWRVLGDPTEGALLAVGLKGGIAAAEVELQYGRIAEHPFDSDRKRMTVVRRHRDGGVLALVKGAPEVILDRCTGIWKGAQVEALAQDERAVIAAQAAVMAERGLRVLAAAQRVFAGADVVPASTEEVERDLVFVGLVGLADPPRPEARQAVALARRAGIRVVMITGDHPRTAGAIARELGIAESRDDVLSGLELDRLDDAGFAARVERVSVYARVTAAHKLRIVRAWKDAGAVVAMTGDGVNDAPAIRGADVGIAMGRTGTEVTKEASDMVITDDDFASIVSAVEQGRGTYGNIRKTLQYLLAGNTGELLLMTAAVLTGVPLPLMPVQLLWINLVTDGLPALCLATDPIGHDVMSSRPRPRAEPITDRSFVRGVLVTGLLTGAVTMAVYLLSLARFPVEMARAHAFSTLVYAELLRAFGARSLTVPIWRLGLASNLRLAGVVAASVVLQLALPHVGAGRILDVPAMPLQHCLLLLCAGAIPLVVLEALKLARRPEAVA